MSPASLFLAGAITTQGLVISVFFLRYAKKTADSFFMYFTIAFLLLAIERVVWVAVSGVTEVLPVVYSFRVAAFLVIIAGYPNEESSI
jgi:hypothetical protein